MQRRIRQVKIRLYAGKDDDLLQWLDGLPDHPPGLRSQAIKEALRRGIRQADPPPAPANVTLDADAVREAVAAAIAHSLDLVEIRRVVEAGVVSALASARVSVVEEGGDESEDDSEAFLDTLGEELLM